MATEHLRVLIVSADPLARAGLTALLAGDAELSIGTSPPHVVAWDLGTDPHVSTLPQSAADVPTLALASTSEQAAAALAAGARGVVLRDSPADRLALALRATAQGLVVLDESLASAVLRPPTAPEAELVEPFTARERDVLGLLAEGLSNRLIAERLGVSEHTAKFHVNAILGKLGAESRTEALVLAARLGLVTL